MLDLVEGAKTIIGLMPTTKSASSGAGDWINMENLHCVWAICQETAPSSGAEFQGFVSQTYAGASATRAVCQYWRSTGVLIDKITASTQTTGLQTVDAIGGQVIIRFDPASRANSTQKYFSVAFTSGEGPKSITYIAQPRYGGLQQILATSSST